MGESETGVVLQVVFLSRVVSLGLVCLDSNTYLVERNSGDFHRENSPTVANSAYVSKM